MNMNERYQTRGSDLILTLLLFCCALFVVSSVYVTTPLTSQFSEIFHVEPSVAAWPTSIFSVFYAIGFLIFGPLSDRFGRKPIILFGLCCLTAVSISIGFIDDFLLFVLLRGLQGLVAATFAPSALAYVYDVFPTTKIATVIGFISFGFVTAGIFGQVVAGIINQTFDWQKIFLIFGGLYFSCAIAVYFFLYENRTEAKSMIIKDYFLTVKRIFTDKNLLICYLITMMLLLTFIGMYTILGAYLSSSPFYLSDKEILTIRAVGVIGMILSLLAGSLIKRYGLLLVFRTGLFMSVVGLVAVGMATNLVVIALMSIFYVAGISITFPAIMLLVGNFGGKERAMAASFYAFILFIGATLGPLLSIWLMHHGSYFITLIVLAALMAIGLTASFFIDEKEEARF
ncbi:MFS transporter [Oceanobacillus longus]|uniref:MFS transporter n=1 Tax=Oceanobacillus longus TaxID=930120 RepID=A0ABV8H0Q7_9BACI